VSLGYPTTKNDIDSAAGGLAVDVRNVMQAAKNFRLMVNGLTDPALEALGYTVDDIARLRSGSLDFDKLADVYLGAATQTPAYDFRTFAKFWLGTA